MQVDLRHRRLLVPEGLLCVGAPGTCGAHDNAVAEALLARGGEEAVDVRFLQVVIFSVELALDRVEFSGAGAGNQVDADILSIVPLSLRPVSVHPDFAVQVGVAGLVLQIALNELLEVGALFPLGVGERAVLVKKRL
jgi:hypothetical protein